MWHIKDFLLEATQAPKDRYVLTKCLKLKTFFVFGLLEVKTFFGFITLKGVENLQTPVILNTLPCIALILSIATLYNLADAFIYFNFILMALFSLNIFLLKPKSNNRWVRTLLEPKLRAAVREILQFRSANWGTQKRCSVLFLHSLTLRRRCPPEWNCPYHRELNINWHS